MSFLVWSPLLLLWPISISAQSKETVIEKYFEAIGGKEKWASVLTKVDSSIFVTLSRSELITSSPDTVTLVTRFMRPNLQRIDRSGKKIPLIAMCFDGTVFWTRTGEGPTDIQPEDHVEYYKSTIMLGFGDLLLEKETVLSFDGEGVLQGVNCNILTVKRREWLYSSKYYFDKESGLLLCVASHESAIKRRTYLKDYRSVLGILWPHLEEAYVGEALESICAHKRILLNVPIEKSEFNP